MFWFSLPTLKGQAGSQHDRIPDRQDLVWGVSDVKDLPFEDIANLEDSVVAIEIVPIDSEIDANVVDVKPITAGVVVDVFSRPGTSAILAPDIPPNLRVAIRRPVF